MPFATVEAFLAAMSALPGPDQAARAAAEARNAVLTKPPGALGRLEDLAIWYCGWRGQPRARVERPQVVVFAGNHGVTARGVSAFPAEVTSQMVANFRSGGAAINQLAALAGARLDVLALDLDRPTADFTTGPAMAPAELSAALSAGWDAVDDGADLLVVGEMGIGNTTAAAALAAALFGGGPEAWCGRGTGVDAAGLARKRSAVAAGLAANPGRSPLEVLRCLGGREIAAMAGAMARARVLRVPVLLDGFIASAAAAALGNAVPGALDHVAAGHVSAEAGHAALLDRLGLVPLLSLGLRLGEGSGAALAIQVLKGALVCHSGMATFSEAGVSDG
jgi:nicotinate-nucleotide--dimethylbenzimidazole phosphoribosyltransferase